MAEYESLGDFFGAVANAIREKKGTTDKIKPIDFPEEIASIVAGGGSLPSGVYFKPDCRLPFNTDYFTHFVLNGKTYIYTRGSSSNKGFIYEYINGAYNLVIDVATTNADFVTNTLLYQPLNFVYKGKVYFYSDMNRSSFGRWDGETTFEILPTLPGGYAPNKGSFFEYNNELYYINKTSSSKYGLYKFNDDTKEFTDYSSISLTDARMISFEYKNETYYVIYDGSNDYSGCWLYKFNGSSFEPLEEVFYRASLVAKLGCYVNGRLYFVDESSSPSTIKCYDLETKTVIDLGPIPFTTYSLFTINNQVHISNDKDYRYNLIMYEVNEG